MYKIIISLSKVGCPSCGFSFCTKCLKKTIVVPKFGGPERKVCLSCWDKITKGIDVKTTYVNKNKQNNTQLPILYILNYRSKKKLNPILPSPLDDPIPDDIQSNLDTVIEQRLAALKKIDSNENNLDITSDETIAIRIANLKEIPFTKTNNIDLLTIVDKRTDEEKTSDLVKQFLNESKIDEATSSASKVDSIEDIEKRLNALRGDGNVCNNRLANDDNNAYQNVENIVKRYMDEAKLPEAEKLTEEEQEFVRNADGKSIKDLEELPWCSICNEDATIRCLGCEGDLFCRSCFNEFHANDEEYREHSSSPYTANKKKCI